jgi:uncharacterized membrane protein YkvA (DUF1232 family)
MKISVNKAKELLAGGFDKAKKILKDSQKMKNLLEDAEKRLQKIPNIGDKLSVIPTLISMIYSYLRREYINISPKTLIVIVSAILYFVSPIDFIIDAVPILGLIDDIAVVSFCYNLILPDIDKYKEWQNNKK